MKRVPILLLLAAPYLFLGICISGGLTGVTLAAWPLICVLSLLPNMIYAFLLPKFNVSGKQLLFWDMLLKLCYIPIYAVIFFLVLLLHILILPLIPVLILFDYSLLLSSSMYGISGIRTSCREGVFSRTEVVVHSILHLLFCLDVFSSIYCYVRARNIK